MLYVKTSCSEGEWHIGEKFPVNPFYLDGVREIQADGDELAFIIRHIHNLPYHDGVSMRWFGDLAKLVAECLIQHDTTIKYSASR